MKRVPSLPILSALVMLCFSSSMAFAQSTPEARSFATQGAKAYQAEDYDTALTNFLKSYELDPDPSMAYNLARAYEAKKDYVNAEKYYRIFVESPDVNVDARQDAIKRIKLMRELIEVSKSEPEPESGVSRGTEPARQAPDPGATPPSSNSSTPGTDRVAPAQQQKSGPSALTWVFLGTGVAAAGTGLAFGLLAGQSQGELADTCRGPSSTLCPESSREIADTMQQRARIADISYLAGGVLVGAGIITWIVTAGKSDEPTSLLTPTFTSSSVGASWRLRF